MPCMRLPFIPTQAPTGSILSSKDSTATFALSPGSRTILRTVIRPSAISGTSISNSLVRNDGDVRDKIITGLLFLKSTLSITALTGWPF